MKGRIVTTIVVAGATLIAGSPTVVGHLNKWESGGKRVLVVYADKLAGGLPTVCDGLTKHITSTPIVVGERWTEEKCFAEESAAIAKVQFNLGRCFTHPPTQSIFDMATSHAWNFGVSATCGSDAMRAWNRGDFVLGCKRISMADAGRPIWASVCKGGGVNKTCTFVQGLANRRQDETRKCIAGLFHNVQSGVITTAPH